MVSISGFWFVVQETHLPLPVRPVATGWGQGVGEISGFWLVVQEPCLSCASGYVCSWLENSWLSTRFRGRLISLRRVVAVLVCSREVKWVVEVEVVCIRP